MCGLLFGPVTGPRVSSGASGAESRQILDCGPFSLQIAKLPSSGVEHEEDVRFLTYCALRNVLRPERDETREMPQANQ